jgi:hypothetical protein
MPRSLPVLGYPSVTAACKALAAEGLSPVEIGDRVGRDAIAVRNLLCAAKRGLVDRRLLLPLKMARALAEEAKMRGVTVAELVEQLLEVVVRDGLYEALLGEAPLLATAQLLEPEGSGHA